MKAPRRCSQEAEKICDVNVQVIGDEEGIMERWKEYFSGLLQGGQQEEESTRNDAGPDPTQEKENIGIEEVAEAKGKLKSGKAPGICGIDAEMLKAGGIVAAE